MPVVLTFFVVMFSKQKAEALKLLLSRLNSDDLKAKGLDDSQSELISDVLESLENEFDQ